MHIVADLFAWRIVLGFRYMACFRYPRMVCSCGFVIRLLSLSVAASSRPQTLEPLSTGAISLPTRQRQAIQGCNLFVFHLPDDWTDEDLLEYFAPHGNVVSAKAGVARGLTCGLAHEGGDDGKGKWRL